MRFLTLSANWIVFIALAMTGATSHGAFCDIFLSAQFKQGRATKLEQAKDKLETIVEDQLLKAGFKVIDDKKTSSWIRFRTQRLAAQLDPYQMTNEKYRAYWIEKLISFKISENLRPIDDEDLLTRKDERKALTQLILRQVILKGIIDLPPSQTDPSRFSRFMKSAHYLRHNLFFKSLVEWRLPRKTIVLSEEQILAIAAGGVDAVLKDDDLKAVLQLEVRTDNVQLANTLVVSLMSMYSFTIYAPMIVEAYEKANGLLF
jgi:hypothetical protein